MFLNIHAEQSWLGLPEDEIHARLMGINCSLTYLFQLRLPRKRILRIGARPTEVFSPGHYLYVGSAKRASGHRLWRHWHGSERHRWHIDYLRAAAFPERLILFRSEEVGECSLAQQLQSDRRFRVVPRFGSSDCACQGHLWLIMGNDHSMGIEVPSFLSLS